MVAGTLSGGGRLEVACDESGYEGDKLIGTTTDVFAHASVRMNTEAAAGCIQELRNRIRSPALEYKANHLLREKHRAVLEWLIGPLGPLRGNAHVYLIDKAFFVVSRVLGLLAPATADAAVTGPDRDRDAESTAAVLYREGPAAFGREPWDAFLAAANELMRAKNRPGAASSVDAFFRAVEALRVAGPPARTAGIVELLRQARPRADSFRARLLDDPNTIPALDPLIPAIVQAVVHWGEGSRPVSIVHDQQTALPEARIAQLKEMFSEPDPGRGGRLAGLRLVDSRSDPRVQVADFLAGTARKIASDELNDRGDARLTALLRPYVDAFSIWGDDRSWSLLAPAPSARPG